MKCTWRCMKFLGGSPKDLRIVQANFAEIDKRWEHRLQVIKGLDIRYR